MDIEQIIENRKQEIVDMNKFLSYLKILKSSVGLSDETINELQLKITARISQCEICVREYLNNK